MPDEFYVVLKGEVGIFPLRLDEVIARELAVVRILRGVIKRTELADLLVVRSEHISLLPQLKQLSPEDQQFISSFSQVTADKVIFKVGYLEEKLGNLPPSVLEDPAFFTAV
jgi:hypothetical protein